MSSLVYILLIVLVTNAYAYRKKLHNFHNERMQNDEPFGVGRVCDKVADLAFVIDSSGSLGQAAFDKELRFVRQVLSEFDVGFDKTRVAVVTFGSFVKKEFYFNEYSSEREVLDAVSRIVYEGGPATLTYRALNMTKRDIFNVRNGERPDIPDITIVVTDGGTNPGRVDRFTKPEAKALTQGEAAQIKRRGIHVFSIGVGPYIDPPELMGICTSPPEQYYMQVDSYDNLNTKALTDLVVKRGCRDRPTPTPPPSPICRTSAADIVFILDKSTSLMNEENFRQELEFVNGVVQSLAIGPSDVQVSVITFSTEAKFEFALNDYLEKGALMSAVRNLRWTQGDTYTDLALDMMIDEAFKPANGARPNVKRIGIIVTDGASTNPTNTEISANRVKAFNVEMFAIGFLHWLEEEEETTMKPKRNETNFGFESANNTNVTNINEFGFEEEEEDSSKTTGVGTAFNKDELVMLASEPKETHVFEVKDVTGLQDKIGLLSNTFCRPTNPTPRPTRRPTPRPTPRPNDCRFKDMDVFFILDKSTSIRSQENFNKELVFVNDFLQEVDVDGGSARLGLMTFSDDPKIEFFLDTYNTELGIMKGLMGVKYTYGNTYTDKAFTKLLDEGFTYQKGARPGVSKVAIIVTDGRSTDPVSLRTVIERVRRSRIEVFAIGIAGIGGVGSNVNIDESELALMASSPASEHVFRVDDLSALAEIRIQLASRVCAQRSP